MGTTSTDVRIRTVRVIKDEVEAEFGFVGDGVTGVGNLDYWYERLGMVCYFDNEGQFAGLELPGMDKAGVTVDVEVLAGLGRAYAALYQRIGLCQGR